MHPTIKFMRWVFIALYVLMVLSFILLSLSISDVEEVLIVLIVAGVFIITQVVFLLGTGTKNFCKPLRRRRLLIPVVVAAFMMAVLVAGLTWALLELLKWDNPEAIYFWGFVVLSWIVWAVLFFIYTRKKERFGVLFRLVSAVFIGSWLQLLVTIPSHIIVSRRPNCFAGFQTMFGIVGGIAVMFWAFGPGIMLLFLKEKRQAEIEGKKLNFSMGMRKTAFCTAAILVLFTSVYIGLRFLNYSYMPEAKAIHGSFICLSVFLVVIGGFALTIKKKQLNPTLIVLALSLICPGLTFLVLGFLFDKNFIRLFSDRHVDNILVGYWTNIPLPYLWIAIALLVPMAVLSFKTLSKLKTDRQNRNMFLRRLILFAVASASIGFSFSTFVTTKADLEYKNCLKVETKFLFGNNEEKNDKEQIVEGKLFPQLKFKSLDGRKIDIGQMKGKVILIDFWATWCGPCRREISTLVSLYNKYHKDGLEIIGISLDRDQDKLESFLDVHNIAWPQYYDGKSWQNLISSRFGINSIPQMILLDKDGVVLSKNLRGLQLEEKVKEIFDGMTAPSLDSSKSSVKKDPNNKVADIFQYGKN